MEAPVEQATQPPERSPSPLAMFRALRHRRFALLWSGQSLSRVGDFLYEVTLALWVLQKTGSPEAMSAVLILALSPMLLFLLIGGVAVDRWPRARVLWVSDLARGVLVLAIAALELTGRLEIWEIYAASLAFGFADAFFQPAYAAFVPEIAPPDVLPSANALTSLGVQAGRIIGPAIATLFIALGGFGVAFAFNGASFLIAAATMLPMLRMPAPERGEAQASILHDLREAFGTVRSRTWLWAGIGLFALTNITLAGPYSVAMPFLVKDHLHLDPEHTLGLLYAVFPIGYILGGLWAGRQARLRRRGVLIFAGTATAGLLLGSFGLPVPLAWLVVAALLNGAMLEIGVQSWTNLLQEKIPREQFGRVSSIETLGSFGLLPVGLAVAGLATSAIGPANVFLLGGALTAVFGVLALATPAIRRLE
jgi:MFS family permease